MLPSPSNNLSRSSLYPPLALVCAKLAGWSTLLLPWLSLDSFRCCQPLENPGLGELPVASTPCASIPDSGKAILSLLVFSSLLPLPLPYTKEAQGNI